MVDEEEAADAPVSAAAPSADVECIGDCAEDNAAELERSDPPRVELSEAVACEALTSAYQDHGMEMGCPVTVRACPDYLRVEQGEACLAYDADSVDRCIAIWRATTSCQELALAEDCEPEAIEGSAPRGCP